MIKKFLENRKLKTIQKKVKKNKELKILSENVEKTYSLAPYFEQKTGALALQENMFIEMKTEIGRAHV